MADALTLAEPRLCSNLISRFPLEKIRAFPRKLDFSKLDKNQVRLGAARVPGLRTSAFELSDFFDSFGRNQDFRGGFDFQK